MKNKSLLLVSLIMVAAIMTSCGNKKEKNEKKDKKESALDIDLDDLKTACDYCEAAEKCIDEMIAIHDEYEENTKIDELSNNDRDDLEALEDKLDDIGDDLSKKFDNGEISKSDMEECDACERADKKHRKIQ